METAKNTPEIKIQKGIKIRPEITRLSKKRVITRVIPCISGWTLYIDHLYVNKTKI